MASQNIEAIRACYAGFRDRDVEGILSGMHPDVEWVHPDGMAKYGLGGTKLGHAGIKEFLAHVPTVLGGMKLSPQEFIEQGDRVIVLGTREVTSHTGTTATLDFVHSWTMRDGRATRMEDIFDTVAFHELIES
ncbi:nuclear transport factor 2 family protein [Streptomyces sp. NBS 14/10]|uniref:nuclear transport factor 2 family protein n=1 Tax=Streptomyces sp. NBS 14/10 TaxID=1945643 RepID=UPI000B7CACAA|nr:nuclear transport factor 2 family protein [Streptomyces sp. NBS 14/10]KAK1182055.1 nuclear transport factor 2 family protein [Streptomyces sp. NBS 14/10]